MAEGLIGGGNYFFGQSETHTLDASNPDFTIEMPRRKGVLGYLLRLDAALSIATGGEDKALDEGTVRLLEQLGAVWNGFQHYPNTFSGRDHLRLTRRMIQQELVQDDLADATAKSNESIAVELLVLFTDPRLNRAQRDMFTGPASPSDTFEIQGRWAVQKTNSASDAGTGVLVKDSDSSGNAVTFDDTPTLTATPIVMPAIPNLPYALVHAQRRVEGPFTTAQDPFDVDLKHTEPTLLTLLATTENGADEDLYDGIDTVTYGDRPDFINVDQVALAIEERARAPATSSTRAGELGIHHSQGTIGTALHPEQDLNSQEIDLSVNAPSGDGKVFATWLTARRRGLTIGDRIRRFPEIVPQGVKQLAQARGEGAPGRGQ